MTLPFDEPVPGLVVVPGFLDDADALLAWVGSMPWLDDLSRRVQHYGWRYDYRARAVPPGSRLGPLPEPLEALAERIHQAGHMAGVPDQAIVNEYLPGQGIAAHIDCEPCFGPEIATLSLGDAYPMRFTRPTTGEAREVWLPVGSLCVMSGPARHEWRHEIARRRSDPTPAGRRPRGRRVSVTFRTVVVG